MITNPKHISVGGHTFIREGARLEAVQRPGATSHGRIVIGDSVGIEQGVHIASADLVEICDGVTIGPRVTLLAAEHPLGMSGEPRYRLLSDAPSKIWIGSGAFLGANCVVLPNVSVGAGAVVGANAVVNRDVPPRTVVAGVPARVLRTLVP